MNKSNKNEEITKTIEAIFILASMLTICIIISVGFTKIQARVTALETQIQETKQVEKELLETTRVIMQEQEDLKHINQERLQAEERRTRSVSNLQSRGFSRYMDISANKDLTADDIDKIINVWDKHVKDGTRFKGHGAAFIEASKKSGLNPIIILAHAASESKWGNSDIAREKNNFFGINCVDNNPDAGYSMGNDIDSGIISGAIWIKKNFYNNGYTTLQSMLDANYASDSNWAMEIVSITNTSIRILQL